jgi:hypothetical protein
MKNTIKMSLAAAVAVSALSTSASAGNLEEMIKGVTASGKINVEYQNNTEDTTGEQEVGTNQTEYDIDMTFKVPVNDNVTATIGFQADHDVTIDNPMNTRTSGGNTVAGEVTSGNTVVEGVTTGDTSDTQVDVTVANFTYANGPVTAIVGKQNVGTPFLYDQKGDGIVGLYNAGPVTLAAAHFVNSNTNILGADTTGLAGTVVPAAVTNLNQGDESINAVAAIGSVAGINLSAWYVTTTLVQAGIADGADAYTLNANGKIGPVGFDVRHSSVEVDGAAGVNFEEEELTKIMLTADVDMFSFAAGYGTTNDSFNVANGNYAVAGQARAHGVSWDDDDTTETGFNGEQVYLDTLNDADAYLLGATANMGAYTAGVTYIDGESDSNIVANDNTEFSELLLSASYAMSKNFTVSTYYSMLDLDYTNGAAKTETDSDEFSLALTYKF